MIFRVFSWGVGLRAVQNNQEAVGATAATAVRSTAIVPPAAWVAIAAVSLVLGAGTAGFTAWFGQRQQFAVLTATGQALADVYARSLERQLAVEAAEVELPPLPPAVAQVRWTDSQQQLRQQSPAAGPPADGPRFTGQLQRGGGQVHVTLRASPVGATRIAAGAAGLGSALLVAAAGGVGLRLLARRARGISAIQRNVAAYASGLERELGALSLSDSLGQLAQTWNAFIAEVARHHQSAGGSGGVGSTQASALTRFEARTLRGILDAVPVGVLRFDSAGEIKFANVTAAQLFGKSVDAVLGQPVNTLLDDQWLAALQTAPAGRHKIPVIEQRIGPEDAARTLRIQRPPAPEGVADEALLVLTDISHLKEADEARDQFLYHVTHELRTPLTNIQAYTETLNQPEFDDEQTRKECYNVIVSETQRLSRLVEDILNLSQLEVGSLRLEWGEVELPRLIRSMVQDNLAYADEKQIDLTLSIPPKVPRIKGDKHRLAVLLNNLIGNAVKYTPQGGRVAVTLTAGESWVQLAVQDSGIGIAPEDQPHVFEKFYRADNEQVQRIKGTGLGLAIAREVARLHGGDIHLASAFGSGSTFTVELPANADKGS